MSGTVFSKLYSVLRRTSTGDNEPNTSSSAYNQALVDIENDGDGHNMQSQQNILCELNLSPADVVEHDIRVVDSISNEYAFHMTKDLINVGASAKVYQASRRSDGQVFALKLLSASKALNKKLFLNEIDTLRRLNHPNIIRLVDAYVDREYFCLVLPLCFGGTLSSMSGPPLSESRAAEIMVTICDVINYLRCRNMAHRDLKPDNFVFADASRTNLLLIDLADAIVVEPSANYSEITGTLLYWAPEILRLRRGEELYASDVWSAGVIAFELLTGETPFNEPSGTMSKIVRKIVMNRYEMPSTISKDCQDFIRALLVPNVGDRVSAQDALALPYLCAVNASQIELSGQNCRLSTPSWSVEEEE